MIHISAMNRVESAEYIQSSMDGFYRVNCIVLKHEHCIDLQRQMSRGNRTSDSFTNCVRVVVLNAEKIRILSCNLAKTWNFVAVFILSPIQ